MTAKKWDGRSQNCVLLYLKLKDLKENSTDFTHQSTFPGVKCSMKPFVFCRGSCVKSNKLLQVMSLEFMSIGAENYKFET